MYIYIYIERERERGSERERESRIPLEQMLLKALRNSLAMSSANVLYSHTRPLRGHSSQQVIKILGLAISYKRIYMSLHFVEGTQSKNNISRPFGVETTSAFKRHTCTAVQSLVLSELVTDLPGSLLAGQTMKYVHLCTKKKTKKIHNYNRHAFLLFIYLCYSKSGKFPG